MTGTEAYSDMKKTKYSWTGVDDDTVIEPTLPKDLPNFVVAIAAQRIRQFYLSYIPVS